MGDRSSNTVSTQSAADIRQDITDYVLKHADEMSDVPGVKQFVEDHGRLTTEIAAAKKLGKRLAKAKEKYEPFENRVLDRRDALKNAEAELAKSHRPLGEASFQAFLAGDLEDQPAFADRLASHKRIQELHQEHGDLTPATDVGMVQKTKAKAQQLAIAGKVKLEEMKCGGMESDIGRQLIESELVESVRCDSTSSLLEQVADNRESLSACSSQLQEADAAREKATKQLCEAIPLQHIESSKTFDAEMKMPKATIRESGRALGNAIHVVTEGLHGLNESVLPETLAQQIKRLDEVSQHDVTERMRGAGDQMRKRGAEVFSSLRGKWSGLSKQGRMKVIAAVCGVLLLALVFSGDGNHSASEVNNANGENSLRNSSSDNRVKHNPTTKSGGSTSAVTIPTYDFSDVVYEHDFSTTDYKSAPPAAQLTERERQLSQAELKFFGADTPMWEKAMVYQLDNGMVVGRSSSTHTKLAYRVPTNQDVTRIQALFESKLDDWIKQAFDSPDDMVAKEYFKAIVPQAGSPHVSSSSMPVGFFPSKSSSYSSPETYILEKTLDLSPLNLDHISATITLRLFKGRWALQSCSIDGTVVLDTFVLHGKRGVFYDRKCSKMCRADHWFHGKQHGEAKQWHENDQLALETAYVDGKQHGVQRHWLEDGSKSKSVPFIKGERHGVLKQWYENGQLKTEWPYVRGKKHGLSKEWHENGKQHNEVPFVHGKRNGTERWWHDNKQLGEESLSSQGLLLSQRRWWPNGNKKLEVVKCKDGKYEGMVHEWHENGAEKTKGQYRSGKLVGTHRVFYDNGSLAKANHYDESGNRDGDALSYYDDGTKQSEGVWVNGKQNGLFKYYYDSEYKGRLQQDDFYNDGQLQLRIGYYSNPNMGNGGIRATTNYVTSDYKIWNPIGELSHHSNRRGIIYQQ